MLDDDETGTCYSDKNVITCPNSNAKVLDSDDCDIYEPDEPITEDEQITLSPTPEPEAPITESEETVSEIEEREEETEEEEEEELTD